MVTMFITMYASWIDAYQLPAGYDFRAEKPGTTFGRNFISHADHKYLEDYICNVFLQKAQYILASNDWVPEDLCSLPRLSDRHTTWGLYVDVLRHVFTMAIALYIGSATNDDGLLGRLFTYSVRASNNGNFPKHHQRLWKND